MRLEKLLQALSDHQLLVATQGISGKESISGALITDSREIKTGDIFVCIRGFTSDGHAYISVAREKKAALVICEDDFVDNLPAIRVNDSRKAAALTAKLQFGNPSSKFRLVGITGTNGKTSTSMILYRAARALGYKAGWIGTLGYYINDKEFSTGHTTPDILELNKILDSMANEEVSLVFMEVSSHAIALDRVYGLEYDLCLFTNLSREHLDFHHDMENYGETKFRFFGQVLAKKAVGLVNTDDSFGRTIHGRLREQDAYAFSIGSSGSDYRIMNAELEWQSSKVLLSGPEGVIELNSKLIGRFNAQNLSMAAATLSLLGMERREIEQGISAVEPIPGRLQLVENTKGIGLFVDYAHTPDALETVLKAVRELPHKRVLCLIGAGGDRDHGKRSLMLASALRYSDAVLISDDNPRTENPNRIILDIISDAHPDLPWWVIRDREEAIHAIVGLARSGDVVLICGKGHETYQEIEGVRHTFSDTEIAGQAVSSGQADPGSLSLPVDALMLQIICDRVPLEQPLGYHPPKTYHHVSTDSRTIKDRSIFFALKGDRFDGHTYLGNVLQSEMNCAVGEISLPEHDRYLCVDSALGSYRKLCKRYLQMFGVYKVAITGSTGKTTTKEMLNLVCMEMAPTHKTSANDNNIIGLCQTILNIKPEHEYSVFELGTNHFGEIAELADTCTPDAGIIVNIGPAHLEALKDESGVYTEKSTLLRRPLNIRMFDADDDRFGEFRSSGKGVGYSELADYRITDTQTKQNSSTFRLNGFEYEVPYTAQHMITNAAFAIAFGLMRGMSAPEIQGAISNPLLLAHRMQEVDSVFGRLILDCYNANPASMRNAIEHWLRVLPGKPHVAILGDMLELGDMAYHYHAMIGAILAEKQHGLLITVGELSRLYHPQDNETQGSHFGTADELLSSLSLVGIPKDAVILVKASHGIRLDLIASHLQGV